MESHRNTLGERLHLWDLFLNDDSLVRNQRVSLGREGFLARDRDETEAFHHIRFPRPTLIQWGLVSMWPAHSALLPQTPRSDPTWKWTPCPHIRTLCTPHIQLPLAHSLGLGLCQWALCPAKGRTTHVKALGVGLAHLGRNCQGSSTWSMVWMGPRPRPCGLFPYWSDSCSGPSKVWGLHCLGLRHVMPFCTFCS